MILFTLRCAADHEFEAWFRDGATFDRQSAGGKIGCPECGDKSVTKAPMAPRVARSRGAEAAPSPAQLRRAARDCAAAPLRAVRAPRIFANHGCRAATSQARIRRR